MPTQEAVRWNIKVSKETDRSLRSLLGSRGVRRGDMSKFVEQAVRFQVFHNTVKEIQQRNRDVDPAVIQAEVDIAVAEVRAENKARKARSRQRS
jgi:hypothetical protein